MTRHLTIKAQVNDPNPDGLTPLHLAAKNGHVATTKYLLTEPTNAKPNPAPRDGFTPLHMVSSTKSGSLQIVELLLDHGAGDMGQLYALPAALSTPRHEKERLDENRPILAPLSAKVT